MKNQKLLAVAALAGLTLGGLTVSAASAQSYDDDSSAPAVETSDGTIATDPGDIVQVQQTDQPDTQDGDVDGERDGRRGHRGGCDLEDAAAAIGIDEVDLRAALDAGDSIADVAEANGVDVDLVIAAMVDAKADRIGEKVTEGRITQEEADDKLAELDARITDRVNGEEGAAQA